MKYRMQEQNQFALMRARKQVRIRSRLIQLSNDVCRLEPRDQITWSDEALLKSGNSCERNFDKYPTREKILFDPKKIVFDMKKIFFDKKKMQTAVESLFPAIETIASAIEAIVFLVGITIFGNQRPRILLQHQSPMAQTSYR
jgi:hypothetical protein